VQGKVEGNKVFLNEPVRAVPSGQSVVVYRDEVVSRWWDIEVKGWNLDILA
jgi:tRNA U34 2-thiouridine synthase MnmA/TrmU